MIRMVEKISDRLLGSVAPKAKASAMACVYYYWGDPCYCRNNQYLYWRWCIDSVGGHSKLNCQYRWPC